MHRTLIALAVIFIFVLLTIPAMAASDDVNADINVSTVWSIEDYGGNHITFTINNGEYANGYCRASGGPSSIRVVSNKYYNIEIEYNCPDGLPDGWRLWTIEGGGVVPLDHSGATYEILDTATDSYWPPPQPPTNVNLWYFMYLLDGIEYEDDWVGNHSLDIIFTLVI